MSHSEIIRAWKDPNYRASLSDVSRALLPAHPAGTIELPDPTLQPTGNHNKGFRLKSGIRAGWHWVSRDPACSAYGENLWDYRLTLD